MCYHDNAGLCRRPQGRSLHCLPGSGQQGAPPSPDTGLHYPHTLAGTHTLARSGGTKLLSHQVKAGNQVMCLDAVGQ